MNKRYQVLIPLIGVTGFAIAAISGCSVESGQRSPQTQSVVFLHGAHLTADSWSEVERELGSTGAKVRALNLPGRTDSSNAQEITLESSSRVLCEEIRGESSQLTLVAHSQAGAIVNHALSICPDVNVEKIVYVAAVVPLNGEKPFEKLSKEDEEKYMKAVAYNESRNVMEVTNPKAFWSSFGVEEDDAKTASLSKLSVDEPASIAEGVVKIDAARFAKPEKFYIFTRDDQIVSFKSQQSIVENLDLVSSAVLDSGHVPMITDSKKLAQTISSFVFDY